MAGFLVVIFAPIITFICFFYLTVILAVKLYIIMSYTFQSISIMCMRKNMGYKNNFVAWIPFYNKYLLGKIAKNKIIGGISSFLSILLICLLIYFHIYQEYETVQCSIFLISLITVFILDTIIAHKIYTSYICKYGDILTVFNVLTFGLLRPIFLFLIRNKKNKDIIN